MFRSFKLKIALSSVLLSGVLLVGLGFFCLQMAYEIGIDRMDRELRALVDTDLRKVQPRNHWRRFDTSLVELLGDQAGKLFILRVIDGSDSLLFESAQWNAELGDAALEFPLPVAGEVVERSAEARERPINQSQKKRPPAPPPLNVSAPELSTVGNWRVMIISNSDVTLGLGINLAPLNAEIARFRQTLLFAIPVGLIIMVGCGWLLAEYALSPVKLITRTARRVSASHLNERVPSAKADAEFRELIAVMNAMLERLERSFQQSVRFSADAAHELKTPLTILQGQLENALQCATDGSADQLTYKHSLDEVQRLKSIIRKLLLLAQADAGKLQIHTERVDFSMMVENVRHDIGILNSDIEVRATITPNIKVSGDGALLGQVVQNLASNAVKFSHGESPIVLDLALSEGWVELTICNRGDCIQDCDRAQVFERFHRTDSARNRKAGGSGLGLSIAREIAQAHGGTLVLVDAEADVTAFRLRIPALITES